jgi:hypothetical protein
MAGGPEQLRMLAADAFCDADEWAARIVDGRDAENAGHARRVFLALSRAWDHLAQLDAPDRAYRRGARAEDKAWRAVFSARRAR